MSVARCRLRENNRAIPEKLWQLLEQDQKSKAFDGWRSELEEQTLKAAYRGDIIKAYWLHQQSLGTINIQIGLDVNMAYLDVQGQELNMPRLLKVLKKYEI